MERLGDLSRGRTLGRAGSCPYRNAGTRAQEGGEQARLSLGLGQSSTPGVRYPDRVGRAGAVGPGLGVAARGRTGALACGKQGPQPTLAADFAPGPVYRPP